MRRRLGFPYEMIAPVDVRRELASDAYMGGAVIPDLGSIHPALYHRGLLQAARAAGVRVFTRTPVTKVARDGKAVQVATARGSVTAREAIIATNGYTPRHVSWLARRIIPFEGFMAATEELSPALMAKIIPNGRTVIDSNVNINFFRPAPDQRKILFGGQTGSRPRDLRDMGARLHSMASRLLPDSRNDFRVYGITGLIAGHHSMWEARTGRFEITSETVNETADYPEALLPNYVAEIEDFQRAVAAGKDPAAIAQILYSRFVDEMLQKSEDVGRAFPEEARKIHYQEAPARSIRGQATNEEHAQLLDEGIAVLRLPVPPRDLMN